MRNIFIKTSRWCPFTYAIKYAMYPAFKAHVLYKAISDVWPILWWSQLKPCTIRISGHPAHMANFHWRKLLAF